MKKITSKCCGTAVTSVGRTTQHAVCLNCHQPCDLVVSIDTGGGAIGGSNVDPNLNIH
ncbi:hypothetical protein VS868_11870 [Salinimicrobium sp. 3283s]|uniref:hypothetical protein n=1 Tax=Salinimicrobium sp. 3283s TaxID=3114359 RepID=UPI0031E7E80E